MKGEGKGKKGSGPNAAGARNQGPRFPAFGCLILSAVHSTVVFSACIFL